MKTNQMHITLNIGKDCNSTSHKFEFYCDGVSTMQLPLYEQKMIFKNVIPSKNTSIEGKNKTGFFERLSALKDMASIEIAGGGGDKSNKDLYNLRVKLENIQFLMPECLKKTVRGLKNCCPTGRRFRIF